jgi:hypothetical protein
MLSRNHKQSYRNAIRHSLVHEPVSYAAWSSPRSINHMMMIWAWTMLTSQTQHSRQQQPNHRQLGSHSCGTPAHVLPCMQPLECMTAVEPCAQASTLVDLYSSCSAQHRPPLPATHNSRLDATCSKRPLCEHQQGHLSTETVCCDTCCRCRCCQALAGGLVLPPVCHLAAAATVPVVVGHTQGG